MFVYVGTYTGPGKAEGIYVYRMDPATGALSHAHTVTGVENPSFLTLDAQERTLYATEETDNGAVSAFSLDPRTGQPTFLNRQTSHGAAPCYVSVHPGGTHVLAANYTSGSVVVFPVQSDGQLGEASQVVQHEGAGPIQSRQKGPHAHCILPDPSGDHVLSCDLGIDKILVYHLDTERGTLVPNALPYGQVNSGAGPRHLAFHPNGRYAYVINEIGCTLTAFAYDAARGALTAVDTQPTLPDDFTARSSCAHVLVHPNGQFVYGSNRGHDSIVIFRIDEERGRTRLVGYEPTQGKNPRNFAIDPTGTYLLAANQSTNTIVTFRIDREQGTLAATGHVAPVPAPVCLVFGNREA